MLIFIIILLSALAGAAMGIVYGAEHC